MKTTPDLFDETGSEFRAGQRAPAGVYIELESCREVRLDRTDFLPASLDGHVAVYVRRVTTWADIAACSRRVQLKEAA